MFGSVARPNYYRLVSFSYGPRPCDWNLCLVDGGSFDILAFADFWEMVDHPERAMPGFWMEEREDPNAEMIPWIGVVVLDPDGKERYIG